MFALKNAQLHYGLKQETLLQDVVTRWNSTDTEWELAEKLVSVLNFVQKGTKMMEGDKYPTISVLGPIVYWIYDSLWNSNIPLHAPVERL